MFAQSYRRSYQTWCCQFLAVLIATYCNFGSALAQDDSGFIFLEVKVVDPTGQPVPEAEVDIKIGSMQFPMPTDEKGMVGLNAPSSGSQLELKVQKEGFVAMGAAWTSNEKPPTEFEIRLQEAISIGGIVHDEEGNPIEGVEVKGIIPSNNRYSTPNQAGLQKQLRPMLGGVIGTTDSEGRWVNRSAPDKECGLQIMFSHPDYVSDRGYGFRGGTWAELKSMKKIVTLKKGIVLQGTITDPDGEPVEGAEVFVGQYRWGNEKLTATTDESGAYRIGKVPPGSNVLTVTSQDWAPEMLAISTKRDMAPQDIQLKPGKSLRIRVVDRDGEPIVGATISQRTWRGYETLQDPSKRGKTDQSGVWEWANAPPDTISFGIYKNGYMSLRASQTTLAASDEVHELTLSPAVVVTGTVVDKATGEPIKEYQYVEGVWWEPNYDRPVLQSHDVQKSNDGRYRFVMQSGCEKFMIRIDAAGYRPGISREIMPDEGEVTIDFELEAGSGPTGVVKDADGELVAGAQIVVAEENQGVYLQNGQIQHQQQGSQIVSDEQGKFALPFLGENAQVICLHDKGYARLIGKRLEATSDITLQPWSRVEGQMRRGSEPLADEQVNLYFQNNYRRGMPQVNWSYNAKTDAKGNFIFDRLIAGEATVSRLVPYAHQGERHMMSTSSHSTSVQVAAGETALVTVGGSGIPIKGKLLAPPEFGNQANWSMAVVQVSTRHTPNVTAQGIFSSIGRAIGQLSQGGGAAATQSTPAERRSYAAAISPEGDFEIFDVEPGDYTISVQMYATPTGNNFNWQPIARLSQSIAVSDLEVEKQQDTLDLGEFTLSTVAPPPAASNRAYFQLDVAPAE